MARKRKKRRHDFERRPDPTPEEIAERASDCRRLREAKMASQWQIKPRYRPIFHDFLSSGDLDKKHNLLDNGKDDGS